MFSFIIFAAPSSPLRVAVYETFSRDVIALGDAGTESCMDQQGVREEYFPPSGIKNNELLLLVIFFIREINATLAPIYYVLQGGNANVGGMSFSQKDNTLINQRVGREVHPGNNYKFAYVLPVR